MKINKLLCLVMLLGGFSSSSFAKSEAGTVYIGGGIGLGRETEICDSVEDLTEDEIELGYQLDIDCDETGFGAKGLLGYRLNDYFSFEFSYSDTVASEISLRQTDDDGDIFSAKAEYSLERFGIDMIGTYPLSPQFSALGKLGWGKTKFAVDYRSTEIVDGESESDSGTREEDGDALSFGVGASFRISDFELRAIFEYVLNVDTGLYRQVGDDGIKKLDTDVAILGLEAMMHLK